MSATCAPEVHVGDVGTKYSARVLDSCAPFDPTTASIKRLIFSLPPNGVVVSKDATLVPDGSPPTEWFLEYVVQAADGPGSPPTEFHAAPGRVRMQAYLEWADGTRFSSDIVDHDRDGHELRVFENLA